MNYQNDKLALIILDGWGKGRIKKADAIAHANTPFMDKIIDEYAVAELVTYGEAVGLPNGQMGNSEVGHLNIGAGRIVYQDLLKINRAIEDKSLFNNKVLLEGLAYAKSTNCKVHLMGLVSDGGVHSHITHLKALIDFYTENGINNLFIHAFTDGRDTAPNGGLNYLTEIETFLKNKPAEIASVIGRYYAMDRDNRWERIKLAYNLLVKGEGSKKDNILDAISESYEAGITDEFLKPIVNNKVNGVIEENDLVLCFNFRTDRCREITSVLTQKDFKEFDMQRIPLNYITMTEYDSSFENIKIIIEEKTLKNTLGEVLNKNNKSQLRCAETEKYPHVTFFFSGGIEAPFNSENRILVNSPKVATYDLQPQMSAPELASKTASFIEENKPDFICINFANPDMVGHTGDFEAVVKAVETTDNALKTVFEKAQEHKYAIIVIADHGNADYMINEDGSSHTAHTKNPVPLIFADINYNGYVRSGKLGDLAPTILKVMNIPVPEEMDGNCLLVDTPSKKVHLIHEDNEVLENVWALVSEKGYNCSTSFTDEQINSKDYDFVFKGNDLENPEQLLNKIS